MTSQEPYGPAGGQDPRGGEDPGQNPPGNDAPGYQAPGYQASGYPAQGPGPGGYYPGPGYQAPGYPPPGYGPAGYPPGYRRTNPLAIASLACGCAQVFFTLFSGIPAIILGHIARRQIRQTGEDGDGLALAGLILGYVGVVLTIAAIIAIIAIIATASHNAGVPGPIYSP